VPGPIVLGPGGADNGRMARPKVCGAELYSGLLNTYVVGSGLTSKRPISGGTAPARHEADGPPNVDGGMYKGDSGVGFFFEMLGTERFREALPKLNLGAASPALVS